MGSLMKRGVVIVMVTLVALYRHPDDIEAFNRHYEEVHIPLVKTMPGLQGVRLTRFDHQADGAHSPYLMMAEMQFLDEESLQEALASEPGRAAGRDLMHFAKGIFTLLVGHQES